MLGNNCDIHSTTIIAVLLLYIEIAGYTIGLASLLTQNFKQECISKTLLYLFSVNNEMYMLWKFQCSLSNSDYFTSAKKCWCKSCIKDFTSAKMEFASAISKKLYFSSIQLKGVVNRLSSFKNLCDHTNRFLMGVMIIGRLSLT